MGRKFAEPLKFYPYFVPKGTSKNLIKAAENKLYFLFAWNLNQEGWEE